MHLHQTLPETGAWFELLFVENNGMAFGMEFGGIWGKLALTLFRIAAVIAIAIYLKHLIEQKVKKGLIISISLIFAGAIGNIIDSTFYGVLFSTSDNGTIAEFLPQAGGYGSLLFGKVVDMFHFDVLSDAKWIPWRGGLFPPVFNVADSAITLGIAFILIRQKSFFPKPETESLEADNLESSKDSTPEENLKNSTF